LIGILPELTRYLLVILLGRVIKKANDASRLPSRPSQYWPIVLPRSTGPVPSFGRALQLFFDNRFGKLVIQAQFSIHLLQPAVLFL
jgi:hypothetical protein